MLYVEIVAPDRKVFAGEAAGIQAPGVQGSFEVRTGHAPMIAAFTVGPLTLRMADGGVLRYATSGGFLEVLDNRVTVLAETTEPADQIDQDRARRAEQAARERLAATTSEAEREKAEAQLTRARNRLRLSMGGV
jgi:F-type H+-transporting ATPase subunit epsilon